MEIIDSCSVPGNVFNAQYGGWPDTGRRGGKVALNHFRCGSDHFCSSLVGWSGSDISLPGPTTGHHRPDVVACAARPISQINEHCPRILAHCITSNVTQSMGRFINLFIFSGSFYLPFKLMRTPCVGHRRRGLINRVSSSRTLITQLQSNVRLTSRSDHIHSPDKH